MFQPSRTSVTYYGRGLSIVTAFLAPFFAVENLAGRSLKSTLIESFWMINQALKGRQLFYLNWNNILNTFIPYEVRDGGPTLDTDFRVTVNTNTVGEYKVLDGGTLVVGWWKPDKTLKLDIKD